MHFLEHQIIYNKTLHTNFQTLQSL